MKQVVIIMAIAYGSIFVGGNFSLGNGRTSTINPNIEKVMESLYGKFDRSKNGWIWNSVYLPQDEKGNSFVDGFVGKRGLVAIIFSQAFKEDGLEKFMLLTQTVPADADYQCPGCNPLVGGVIFVKEGQEWKIEAKSLCISKGIGAWGRTPKPKLVKNGPNKIGVIFLDEWQHMGFEKNRVLLIASTGKEFKKIFELVTLESNFGSCEKNTMDPDKICWAYKATFDFVPGNNPNYYIIKTVATGTRDKDGKIVSANQTSIYSYDNGKYNQRGSVTQPAKKKIEII